MMYYIKVIARRLGQWLISYHRWDEPRAGIFSLTYDPCDLGIGSYIKLSYYGVYIRMQLGPLAVSISLIEG